MIPTHNRAKSLVRALASVHSQATDPSEIIVVDDGSTDGSYDRVRNEFPDVTVLRQSNRGVSVARNAGIRASRGEFIAFLDSDDEWLPAKLERQLDAMADTPDTLLCHTNEIWIRNGRRVNPMKRHQKYGGFIFEQSLPRCIISPSSVLVRRRVFDTIGYFDESLPACEDYDLWLRITARHPVLFIDEKLIVKYGGHPDQLSRRYSAMDRFRIRAIEKILAQTMLDEVQRKAAESMLAYKIRIYNQGALKRGRPTLPVS